MKKIFTLLLCAALFAGSCWGATSSVLLNEHFNRNIGTLNVGSSSSISTNKTNWWNLLGTKYIQVVDTSLTFSGYQSTASGKAIEYIGNVGSDIRAFSSSKNSGCVFLSCIVRIKNPARNSGTSISNFISMASENSNSKQFGKILYQPSGSGFKLAPGKYTESATYLRWSDELEINKEYLLVLCYKFVSGTKNDEVSLWINPSKNDSILPTIIQKQDTTTGGGSAAGTNTRDDAASLGYVVLASGSSAPKDIIIDEVRVSTKWGDLFEAGLPTPVLNKACSKTDLGTFSAEYEPQKTTITITGSNLTENVTITSAVGVNVDSISLTKESVMAPGGAVVTVTSNANFSKFGNNITFTSGTASTSISITGNPAEFAEYGSIQALNNNTSVNDYAALTAASTSISSVNTGSNTFVIGNTYTATINYESVLGTYAVGGTISGLKVKKTAENTYKALAFNYTAPSGSIITIHEGQDNTTTLSEHAGDQNISLDRAAFLPNMFNTICLPFDVSEAQKAIRFGSSQVIQLKSSKYNNNEITLTFVPVSQLVAGEPYLINPENNSISFSFSSGYELVNTTGSTIETDYVDFVGIINPTELPQSKEILFMGKYNQLYWPTEAGTLKGLRCYFQVKNTAVSGAPVRMVINKDNTVTNIVDVNANANVNRKVMLNGQLIIIRDGVKFNAQGSRL